MIDDFDINIFFQFKPKKSSTKYFSLEEKCNSLGMYITNNFITNQNQVNIKKFYLQLSSILTQILQEPIEMMNDYKAMIDLFSFYPKGINLFYVIINSPIKTPKYKVDLNVLINKTAYNKQYIQSVLFEYQKSNEDIIEFEIFEFYITLLLLNIKKIEGKSKLYINSRLSEKDKNNFNLERSFKFNFYNNILMSYIFKYLYDNLLEQKLLFVFKMINLIWLRECYDYSYNQIVSHSQNQYFPLLFSNSGKERKLFINFLIFSICEELIPLIQCVNGFMSSLLREEIEVFKEYIYESIKFLIAKNRSFKTEISFSDIGYFIRRYLTPSSLFLEKSNKQMSYKSLISNSIPFFIYLTNDFIISFSERKVSIDDWMLLNKILTILSNKDTEFVFMEKKSEMRGVFPFDDNKSRQKVHLLISSIQIFIDKYQAQNSTNADLLNILRKNKEILESLYSKPSEVDNTDIQENNNERQIYLGEKMKIFQEEPWELGRKEYEIGILYSILYYLSIIIDKIRGINKEKGKKGSFPTTNLRPLCNINSILRFFSFTLTVFFLSYIIYLTSFPIYLRNKEED